MAARLMARTRSMAGITSRDSLVVARRLLRELQLGRHVDVDEYRQILDDSRQVHDAELGDALIETHTAIREQVEWHERHDLPHVAAAMQSAVLGLPVGVRPASPTATATQPPQQDGD